MLDTIAWSQPSIYTEGTGVHHGYSTAPADSVPSFLDISKALIVKSWYAKLDPGGFIVPHVDKGPWVERWHYPISGQGYVWQEGEVGRSPKSSASYYPRGQNPYAVLHHQVHAAWNPFDEPRVVLIVEYDNPVDQPTTDLILCDMIPEIQEMIDTL